jgi:hypothetical protein
MKEIGLRISPLVSLCLLVTLSVMLTGCDLFSTREPESPDMGSQFIWTPASTPHLLLENFKGSLEQVDGTNHSKCFISDNDSTTTGEKLYYHFVPRSGLDASRQALFDSWNPTSEKNYLVKLRTLIVKDPKLSVVISNEKIEQNDVHSAKVDFNYTVLIPVEGTSTVPSSVTGAAQYQAELVTTEQGTKEWRIVWMYDYVASGSSSKTITDLKAEMTL